MVKPVVERSHIPRRSAERGVTELGHQILGRIVLGVVEHAAHDVIDWSFQAEELAWTVALNRLDVVGDEPLHLDFHETGRTHGCIPRAEVRAPIVDVAGAGGVTGKHAAGVTLGDAGLTIQVVAVMLAAPLILAGGAARLMDNGWRYVTGMLAGFVLSCAWCFMNGIVLVVSLGFLMTT